MWVSLPPATTWGKMLADSVTYVTVMPTYLFIPGTALFFVVLVFNQLGDSVRDALDRRAGRVDDSGTPPQLFVPGRPRPGQFAHKARQQAAREHRAGPRIEGYTHG